MSDSKIVPAILTDKKDEFIRMLKSADIFSEHNQIDIMDAEFVPSKSITLQELATIDYRCTSFVEAHLMVEEPLQWVDTFNKLGAKRIIFHFEINADKLEIITKIRESGLSVGLAVNPSTKNSEVAHFVEKVDTVLFLSVNPGFYGSAFIPGVLDKIKKFRNLYPRKPIGIDGGIKRANIKEASSLGIDFICVGSAIFNAEDPAQSYREFSLALRR